LALWHLHHILPQALEAVSLELNGARFTAEANADALGRLPRFDHLIFQQHDRLGRADVDGSALRAAVVDQAVLDQAVAMAGELLVRSV
jgi:hypothetical protein